MKLEMIHRKCDTEIKKENVNQLIENIQVRITKDIYLLILDVWQRSTRKPLPLEEGLITRFEIPFARICGGENGDQGSSKKYVVYDVCCRQDTSTQEDKNPTTIERRYTDFLKLYDALKKQQPQLIANIAFPKKRIMGNFTSDLISERSVAFENFLDYILSVAELRECEQFLNFLQDEDLSKACRLVDERRNELAIPILENSFQLLNKVFLDKSRPVLLLLCRLVAACTSSPIPHPSSQKFTDLALRRFEHVSDTEILVLYIPLLNSASYLYWQKGLDASAIKQRIDEMGRKGIKIKDTLTLTQALHAMEQKSETF
jgi:hypothetical protein